MNSIIRRAPISPVPDQPIQPTVPVEPTLPIQPTVLVEPALPIQPTVPVEPALPIQPIQPPIEPSLSDRTFRLYKGGSNFVIPVDGD
jgi:hypothetical protein